MPNICGAHTLNDDKCRRILVSGTCQNHGVSGRDSLKGVEIPPWAMQKTHKAYQNVEKAIIDTQQIFEILEIIDEDSNTLKTLKDSGIVDRDRHANDRAQQLEDAFQDWSYKVEGLVVDTANLTHNYIKYVVDAEEKSFEALEILKKAIGEEGHKEVPSNQCEKIARISDDISIERDGLTEIFKALDLRLAELLNREPTFSSQEK